MNTNENGAPKGTRAAQVQTIVCYGDSNTWGNIPRTDDRYPRDIRWPGALQKNLGSGYEVISEGLCGRTFVATDPAKPHRTGITHLQSIIESADPIDAIIIMLGTNDVKTTYNLEPAQIAEHLAQTIELIQHCKELNSSPKILVVCPPPVIIPKTKDLNARMVHGPEKFAAMPALFKEVAHKHGCDFINAGNHIISSDIDGYHLDEKSHLIFAGVIAEWVKERVG